MRNLFLALTILLYATSFAQKERMNNLSPAEKTQKFINHWTKELALTPEQQAKANPIVLNMFTKTNELKMDTTMEKKARNKALKNSRKTGIDGFKALLTADQAATYDKRTQEMKDKSKERKAGANKKGGNKGVKKAAENEIGNEDVF